MFSLPPPPVLHHLRRLGALTLFATHYHGLVQDFQGPGVGSHYMGHLKDDSKREVVFLYRFLEGVGASYGLNVAQLAGLDESILSRAQQVIDEASAANLFDTSRGSHMVARELFACQCREDVARLLEETGLLQ